MLQRIANNLENKVLPTCDGTCPGMIISSAGFFVTIKGESAVLLLQKQRFSPRAFGLSVFGG
jgi:hypothetical protein